MHTLALPKHPIDGRLSWKVFAKFDFLQFFAFLNKLGPLVCINSGSGADCDIAFADAGFKFLYGATNTLTIPTQVAGNNFSDTLKLQAVKDNNGVCTGLFSGNVNVDLAQQSISW